MKKNKIIFSVLIIIFSFGFIYSMYKIIFRKISLNENDKIKKQIEESVIIKKEEKKDEITGKTTIEEKYVVDFDKLKKQNNDTIAYLNIKNTNISYAVVKGKDNEYYLNHNFNKKYNSAGWIFADYKNKFDGTDKNIVIYGHSMKDGSMFGSLYKIFNSEWLNNKENLKIVFNINGEDATYKIFSMYRIEAEEYYIQTEFNNEEEFNKFINKIKSRDTKGLNVNVDSNDQVLTLSTCTSDLNKRIVVHAKKIN